MTYLEIEPEFGSWEDIRSIGEEFDVLVDLMVNHISRQSPYFQDFLEHGRASEYADLFLTLDKIWENGEPVPADIGKMFLRRPLPYSTFTTSRGRKRRSGRHLAKPILPSRLIWMSTLRSPATCCGSSS